MKSMVKTMVDYETPLMQLANVPMKFDTVPELQYGFSQLRFITIIKNCICDDTRARLPLIRNLASRAKYHDYIP
jgi:hypothetical protein